MHPKIEILFNTTKTKSLNNTEDIKLLINHLYNLGASMTEAWIVLYKGYKIDEFEAEEILLDSNLWKNESHTFRMHQVALYLKDDFGETDSADL
ncbi:hypothetical protein ATE84_4035 [Aquimarina sp. MAR_2010_214]|uniref:hypothetical protein n=1 Tax=Aquimarina sp. MAR_2010_214 TaxID=1250026 RepID=UPI000C707B03|nr:hypothetical protein [Aquimarina sp. MAR_2010_214]PKV51935.1 hypothetical protein ATE84_4035 [Aquimarina sp. MAR_2010_214]